MREVENARPKSMLRDAQQRMVSYLYEHDRVQAVVPMGGGKTAGSMTAIQEMLDDRHIRCAVVMAPRRVCNLVWTREHEEWEHLTGLKIVLVSGTPARRKRLLLETEADIYVVGIDVTQWLVELLDPLPADHKLFDLLLIDESSRFKSPKGKRGKALLKIADRFRTFWQMTGTPRPNGFEDQFMPMSLLTAGRIWGRSFDSWRRRHFIPLDYNEYNWTIAPHARDKIIKAISKYSFTVSDADMPDLPEMAEVFHWVELNDAERAVYSEMEREYMAETMSGEEVVAANAAVASGKLAQAVQGFMYDTPYEENPQREVRWIHDRKLEQLREIVDTANGNPLLVAYEFQEDLDRLLEAFPDTPYFGPGRSDEQDAEAERAWNRGDLPLLFGHAASVGHGLNLQHGGNQIVIYGMTWSSELHDQMRKRIHRPGQTETCFFHYILCRETIDEVKYNRVILKMTEQDAFRAYLETI